MTPVKTEDLMKIKAGDKVRVYSSFCFEHGISAYDAVVKGTLERVENDFIVRMLVLKGNGLFKDDFRANDHSVFLHEIYEVSQ